MEEMMTLKAVAKLIGLHPRTLRRWRADKRCPVPFYRIGTKAVRAHQADVMEWINSLQPARPDAA